MTLQESINLALALAPAIEHEVESFTAWITALRTTAQQSGEWSDAMEADYRAKLEATSSDPKYQPDPPAAPAA